jgi:hypothetical protein
MTPSMVLALACRILSETGMPVGNPVQIVAPGDVPAIEARIAPLRTFRRQIDGVLDPVIYVVRTTQTFERATAGHAPSAVLVASSIFHTKGLHGTDDAIDEPRVLTQEAAFLQRYISRTFLHLSTADRWFLEWHIDQLRALAKRIVPSFQNVRGPSVQEVIQ